MDRLFLLKVRLSSHPRDVATIQAWDRPSPPNNSTGHSYIDVEVSHMGQVIFPRGQLYCGVNAYTSTDGEAARALVLSLVAMKPGDTDSDYFQDYTNDQIEWATAHGDEISMVRESRYGDL